MRVVAVTADWYRVALPDGTRGFIIARATEPLDSPIGRHSLSDAALVRHLPAPTATPVADVELGARVPVLGRYDNIVLAFVASSARAPKTRYDYYLTGNSQTSPARRAAESV